MREALAIDPSVKLPEHTLRRYNGKPSVLQEEEWRISNNRREIDLLSVVDTGHAGPNVLQVETKRSSSENEQSLAEDALNQVKWFKEYLERTHGANLNNASFALAVALPMKSPTPYCHCQGNSRSVFAEKYEVTEDGKNKGRNYHACCRRGNGSGACGFFQWVGADTSLQHEDNLLHDNSCSQDSPVEITAPAHTQHSRKAGSKPNDPRKFELCPNEPSAQCRFLRWVGESIPVSNLPDCTGHKEAMFRKFRDHFLMEEDLKNDEESKKKLSLWWSKHGPGNNGPEGTNGPARTLVKNLITLSAMVITKLPRFVSSMNPDSQMILMR